LRAHNVRTPLALTAMLVGMLIACGLLGALMAYSINGLIERLGTYSTNWSIEMTQLDVALETLGFTSADLASSLSVSNLVGPLTTLVSGLLDLVSQAVLVLLMMLFFLGEGAALVDRLRAALGEQSPTFHTITEYGRDIGRYFALRAAVNAVTGLGVALVLF